MMGNIYLDLTNEFNEGRLRAILSGNQAVVIHKILAPAIYGDWIVREDSESLEWILEILESHGAFYRFGAPLDGRWMNGGWSAHFEFSADGNRIRCDFVTRPPRITTEDLRALWDEQERGENGSLAVPTLDMRRLAEIKKTDRERDYPFIGELARRMPPRDQLLQSRSALDLMELVKQHPDAARAVADVRPLLQLLLNSNLERRAVRLALSEEQIEMMEKNEARIAAYSSAAKNWQMLWPKIQKEARGLPLRQAHRLLIESARAVLPENADDQ